MRELVKNFFLFGLAIALEKAIMFFLIPLYSRVFSVEQFGSIDLIQSFQAFIEIFAYLQLETAFQRNFYKYEGKERKSYIYTILSTIFILSLLLVMLVIFLSSNLSFLFFDSFEYAKLIRYSIYALPFSTLTTMFLIVLRYKNANIKFFIVVFAKSILLLGLVYLFLIELKYSIAGFFIAQLLSAAIAFIIACFFLMKDFFAKYELSLIKEAFRYSLPQLPARFGSAFNSYGNRFFMITYLSTYEIGIYSMALKVSSIMMLVHITFTMAWNQFLFKMVNKNDYKGNVKCILAYFLPLLAIIVILLTLLSTFIVGIMAPTSYFESSNYIGFISLSFMLTTVNEFFNIGPKITLKTKYLSYSFICSFIINFLILFFLVPMMGLKGVVFAMFMSVFILCALNWFFTEKLIKIEFSLSLLLATILPVLLLVTLSLYQALNFNKLLLVCSLYILYYLVILFHLFRKHQCS